MVLEQDKPQASQAQAVLDEQQYQKDLIQYEKDIEEYNKLKNEYNKEQKEIAEKKAAELKRKAEIEAAEKAKEQKLAQEAQSREDAYKAYMKNAGSGTNKSVSKQIHYGNVGVPLQTGDIILKAGRGTTSVSFHESYYQRALDHYHSRGGMYSHMTLSDVKSISAAGRRSLSGKSRDAAFRNVLDKTGALEAQYQASRAQAKRNVASAYGSMSAKEASTSSALANNPEAQQKAALENLHNVTGGLIGKKEETLRATSSDPVTASQNAKQTQYVSELRQGNVGLATALLQPQTEQQYSTNTVNLRKFLSERGYDVSNPDTIPDVVLKEPVKYNAARKQASDSSKPMGDLRKLIPSQPQVSDNVIQQRKETMEKYAIDKGGSFIGYGDDGTPVQGPPDPEFFKQQYQVTTADGKVRTFNSLESAEKFSQRMTTTQYEVNVPTSIPTMYGAVTVQEAITFDSKEEAQSFIDKRQASLPYTQDAKILPLEQMYSGYDQFAKEAYKRAEDHPDSWIYQGGAAWTSFGGDMLNLATMGGDLLDKYVFDRPTIEKQPITTIPTYYDKGTEKALEGIEITETGITGVPSFNPLDKNNIASKWYQGAVAQWEKQTPAQNIGQSTLFVPVAIIDTVTAGQAGTSFVRRVAPGVKSLATKIASTPTIVTKVIEASSISVKTIPVKPSYANYNINSLSNPDRIDLNLKGVDYMDSSKPPGINLQSKAFQEDLANKGIKPVDLVKLDPEYTPEKIDLNLKGDDFMVSPKPPTLNLKSKAFQEDLAKQAPRGVGNYGAERFRQFQENVSPSVNVVGRIKFSEGFVPGKPTRAYTPYRPKPVEADPYYSPEKIDLNLKGDDFMVSPKPKLNLQSKAFLKEIKKDTPNYERAASDFADFQKSLDPKPQRYSNIVGTIKFSDGFIPNKNPTKVTKKSDTGVKEEPLFKQDKINKKKIFSDDDKLAGWETKPVDGGQGTGTTTVQLVKSETKKPLKTSQKLLQDKKNPTPIARDFTKVESERTVPKTGSSPLKLLPIPRDVRKKKKKPIETVTTTATITTAETSQAQSLKPTTQPISGVITTQTTRQSIRSRQTTRAATKISQTPIAVMQQPQKITPVIKQSLRSSPRPRPRLRSRPKFRFKAKIRPIQSQPSPIPGRARTVAGFAPPSEKKKEEEKKSKKKKRKEFLGNTRLDKIEGLFRRSEIISGDKRVAKQEKLDRAFKENKKKTRRKKTKQSFSQKMGIVSKGFKI